MGFDILNVPSLGMKDVLVVPRKKDEVSVITLKQTQYFFISNYFRLLRIQL